MMHYEYWIYRHIETIENSEPNNNETLIKNCVKLHMFAHFPDGSIQIKENFCTCCSCLNVVVWILYDAESKKDTTENADNLINSNFKENVLHCDILFHLLTPGGVNPSKCKRATFLRKFIDVCHANSSFTDYYNHFVAKGTKFIECYYLEKVSEKKGFIKYRQLDRDVFVLPLQIWCPAVSLKEDFTLSSNEYQFISDML